MSDLIALGVALRAAGLTTPGFAAWAGTTRLPLVPGRIAALAARDWTPAATALALFVAGTELASERAARLPVEALVDAGLVERVGATVRATCAILPHARGLLVCDRADAPSTPELVCWPDDSSLHLAQAVPRGRRSTWLDLACGSAVAQLARPELAVTRLAADLNPRAVRFATWGAALSGIALQTSVGDIGAAGPRAELLTCNAPIPAAFQRASSRVPMWRTTSAAFFERLFAEAVPRRLVEAPTSLVVVHARRDQLVPAALPGGEAVRITYTPEGSAPGFAILWWRPFAPARCVDGHRALTASRPHLDAEDREAALLDGAPG